MEFFENCGSQTDIISLEERYILMANHAKKQWDIAVQQTQLYNENSLEELHMEKIKMALIATAAFAAAYCVADCVPETQRTPIWNARRVVMRKSMALSSYLTENAAETLVFIRNALEVAEEVCDENALAEIQTELHIVVDKLRNK